MNPNLCVHCSYNEKKKGALCERCAKLPRCNSCTAFFNNEGVAVDRVKAKIEITRRLLILTDDGKTCVRCKYWQDDIKYECRCGKPIQNNPKRFLAHGNFCAKCILRVNKVMNGKRTKQTCQTGDKFQDQE